MCTVYFLPYNILTTLQGFPGSDPRALGSCLVSAYPKDHAVVFDSGWYMWNGTVRCILLASRTNISKDRLPRICLFDETKSIKWSIHIHLFLFVMSILPLLCSDLIGARCFLCFSMWKRRIQAKYEYWWRPACQSWIFKRGNNTSMQQWNWIQYWEIIPFSQSVTQD